MANFPPLKRYIFYCLDKLIEKYHLTYPFLDVGCGKGDTSVYMAEKGWHGKAIDISPTAFETSLASLQKCPSVELKQQSLFDEKGKYKTIFAMDILEHLHNDEETLRKIAELLDDNGYMVIAVPSNPREWRWDDDYAEHVRRYTVTELADKLARVHLKLVVLWDFTFPVFWFMRRMYTWIKKSAPRIREQQQRGTELSAFIESWHFPIISDLLSKESFLWKAIYRWQFKHFKHKLEAGHEMIVLARKN